MGKPSLVQFTLYKQWMWAKDVALSGFPVGACAPPDFVRNEPTVTGDHKSLGHLKMGMYLGIRKHRSTLGIVVN
eukprot:7199801-Pyramimonas_sp.AAC.1